MTTVDTPTYDSTSRVLDGPQPVHYHVTGHGPGLLLLHGSGPGVSGWANFGDNLPALAEHFTCVLPDLPGYGASFVPELDSAAAYFGIAVDAVRRVLAEESLDAVDVVGNSLGGVLAVQLALDSPAVARRLVLMGPGGLAPALLAPQPTEGIARLVEFTQEPTRERLVAWMRSMVGDPRFLTEERIEQRWQAASAPGALDFTRAFYRAALRPGPKGAPRATPIWARLGELTQPTLLTYGRDDRVTPLESALHPLRHIRRVELHVFGNCGHWAMQERKAEFERVVLEFLTRD